MKEKKTEVSLPNDRIVIVKCQECNKEVQLWMTFSGTIIGVRCPDCFAKWKKDNETRARQAGLKIIKI